MNSEGDSAALNVGALADVTVNRAIATLRSACHSSGTTALTIVVDPTLADPLSLSDVLKHALESGRVSRHSLVGLHANFAPDKSPYLIHAPDELAAERCMNESVRIAVNESLGLCGDEYRGRSVCAWVVGESQPAALAERLVQLSRVRGPDRKLWPLRYWDPRVFWHLPRVLQPGQFSAMCRMLGRWHQLDQTNSLAALPLHAVHGERVETPLVFDDAGWAPLSRVGQVNRVLGLAWDWGVMPTTSNAARIDVLLQQCHALGFSSEQDELAFCACGLTSRDDFYLFPIVGEALGVAARQGLSVIEALAPFDDAFWAGLQTKNTDRIT